MLHKAECGIGNRLGFHSSFWVGSKLVDKSKTFVLLA